jgi:serine/threonine protein kinase
MFDSCLELPPAKREELLANFPERAAVLELLAAADSQGLSELIFRQATKLDPLLEAGSLLSEYSIIEPIGSGATSIVYRARHIPLDRQVALKLSSLSKAEARAIAKLDHPNIVQVFATETYAGRTLIAMQYVQGMNLQELMDALPILSGRAIAAELSKRGLYVSENAAFTALTPIQILEKLIKELGSALRHAHHVGIYHFDIKPANVLVDCQGKFHLTDFGVAWNTADSESKPLGGTRSFMAPEQLTWFTHHQTAPIPDAAADQYAFGVVIKQLLSHIPIPTALHELTDTGFANTYCAQYVRRSIEAITTKMTATDPAERYPTMDAVIRRGRGLAVIRRCLNERVAFILKHPVATAIAVVLLANGLASVLQIAYNDLHIAGALTPAQHQAFQQTLGPWNGFIFSVGIAYLIFCYRFAWANPTDEANNAKVRRALLRIPWQGLFFIASAWTCGWLIFATVLAPMQQSDQIHLAISFAISMSIPVGFCFLAAAAINVLNLYPQYLLGVSDIPATVRTELAKLVRSIRFCRYGAAATPLLGCVVAVFQGSGTEGAGIKTFQLLVVGFVLVTAVWFVVAGQLVDRVNALWQTLSASD